MKLSNFLAYFILFFTSHSFAINNDEQSLFPSDLTVKILDSQSINESTIFSFVVNGEIVSLFSEAVITARVRCIMNIDIINSNTNEHLENGEVFNLVFLDQSIESSYSSYFFKFINEKENHELTLSCHSLRNNEFNLDTLTKTLGNLVELY